LADVEDLDGNVLGIVNTVQNANTQTLNGSISMDRIYRIFGIQKNQKSIRQILSKKETDPNAPEGKKKPKKKKNKKVLRSVADVLSIMKRVQFTYSENNGKVLPGYLPTLGFGGTLQPTAAFTFGSQADIRYEVARNGWLTDFPDFNQQFTQVHNNQLKITGQLDFGKGLLIDLTAERNFSENLSENFSVVDGSYVPLNPNSYGNFGMSTLLIRTAFNKPSGSFNPNFEKFRKHRLVVAQRLASAAGIPITDVDEEGFPRGYGKSSQSVVIPAFLAAYSGSSAEQISLDPIKKTPLPNWNLKYTGLMNIKSLKKIFNRFSLTHAYRSSYTINNFQTNLDYDPSILDQVDDGGNFVPSTLFSNLNLVEQFNPLIRIDLELKNSFKFLAELKTDRALSLSLDNNLLTESNGQEYIVGMGYRLKDLRFNTRIGGRRKTLKGDLNIKADLSYRNNITVLRNLEINDNQVTAGQTLWSIKLTADYALSRNLISQFFYDHNFSEFAISSAFPQTSIRSGISIRYNFGN
jgi:cell surface protein SprA